MSFGEGSERKSHRAIFIKLIVKISPDPGGGGVGKSNITLRVISGAFQVKYKITNIEQVLMID